MSSCLAVISGALTPSISSYPGCSTSRSIVKLKYKNRPLFQFQRHSKLCSDSLSLQKRVVSNGVCDVSQQCCPGEAEVPSGDDFVVVNFYRFVFIRNPVAEVDRHLSFLKVCFQSFTIKVSAT